jgi:hypothetical protein
MNGLVSPVTAAAILAAGLSAGCCDGGPDPLVQDPATLITPYEPALNKPTGTISEANVADIFSDMATQYAVQTIAATVPVADAILPGTLNPGIIQSTCISSASDGETSIDAGCASSGSASGTVRYKATIENGVHYMAVNYRCLCVNSQCIQGDLVIQVEGTNVAGTQCVGDQLCLIDVDAYSSLALSGGSFSSNTNNLDYGYTQSMGGTDMTLSWVIFDAAGSSYLFSNNLAQPSGSDLQVTDTVGTYTCKYTLSGQQGSCTGPLALSWGSVE